MFSRAIATALGIIFAVIALACMAQRSLDMDSTDAPGQRSGLIIFTDNATGVQYLGSPLLGLTVRVDRDGRPFSDARR